MIPSRIEALQRRIRLLRRMIRAGGEGLNVARLRLDLVETERLIAPAGPDAARLDRFAASPATTSSARS